MAKKSKSKLSKQKAHNYAINILAKADGISYREAQRKYRRAQLDVVVRRAATQTQDEWLQVNNRNYFKIKKGMQARLENTTGPSRSAAYVEGRRKQHIYWNTVELLAGVMGTTKRKAQGYIAEQKKTIQQKTGYKGKRLTSAVNWSVWIDLGVYSENYRGSPV